MRLVIAQCQVDYAGRLTAHLPMAKRLILVKSDGSVSIHADDRAYKPLNWMSPPCTLTVSLPDDEAQGDRASGRAVDSGGEVVGPQGERSGAPDAGEQVVLEPEALAHQSEVPVETELTQSEPTHPELATDPQLPSAPEHAITPERTIDPQHAITQVWQVRGRDGDTLQISLGEVYLDTEHDLGIDPGLQKDGVEAHLQALLAENPGTFGEGWTLVRREHPTAIGPVDILLRDHTGRYVAVEVKRRGEIDGVEQLTRYLELLNRDPRLAPVDGVFAAQQIKPQARVLAGDRGITCLTVDYDALRGMDNAEDRLF